ncbi:MAG: NAD(P)-dependent oxidoreductase [Pseudomonadota bacterium]
MIPSHIIIVGATGFLGRNLVTRMSGRSVLTAVSGSGRAVPGADQSMRIDQLSELPKLPQDCVVINLAAQPYDAARFDAAQSDILTTNIGIVHQVYRFCVEREIKEVRSASSVAVYPAGLETLDDEKPVDLSIDPNPNEMFYGWSKRWSEIAARLYSKKFGISTLSFRLSNPYGPYDSTNIDKAHVLPAFVMRALGDEPEFTIRGNAKTERDFVFAEDVCDVFERSLAWSGTSDQFNLCTGTSVDLQALAETLLRLVGKTRPIKTGETLVQSVLARRATNAKLKAAFDKSTFTSLESGLKHTLDWYANAL